MDFNIKDVLVYKFIQYVKDTDYITIQDYKFKKDDVKSFDITRNKLLEIFLVSGLKLKFNHGEIAREFLKFAREHKMILKEYSSKVGGERENYRLDIGGGYDLVMTRSEWKQLRKYLD